MSEVPDRWVKLCERCGENAWRGAYRRSRCQQCYRLLCHRCQSFTACNNSRECRKVSLVGKRAQLGVIVHRVLSCDTEPGGKAPRLHFACDTIKTTSWAHVKKVRTKEPLNCIGCLAYSPIPDVPLF